MSCRRFVLLLATLITAGSAYAAEPIPLTWYDGDRQLRVWLDPSQIVQFGAAEVPVEALGALQGVAPQRIGPGVRLWPADLVAAAGVELGATSPLLRDSPAGGLRALPGGVLVRLQRDWSAAQVQDWLDRQGLQRAAELALGGNMVMVDSQPGLPALELANRLHALPEVVSAQPNWWQPREAR